MLTKLTTVLVLFFSVIVVLMFASVRTFAAFDPLAAGCSAGNAANGTVCKDSKDTSDPVSGKNGVISTAANIIALVAGVVAVAMIVVGGIMFVTAGGTGVTSAPGGSQTRAARARAMIISAITGLVIVALAWAITTFIISHLIS